MAKLNDKLLKKFILKETKKCHTSILMNMITQ